MVMFFLYKLNSWHRDIKTLWQEEKEKRSSLRCQPAKFFLVITGNLQLCRCVCLSSFNAEPLGLGGDQLAVCVDLSAWAVLMAARGYWKAKGMCVWAGNSCYPPSNDYLCSLCLIYGHTWSLHALMNLQQDRQDAVNVLNTPDDECFHFVQGALLQYIFVGLPVTEKKKKLSVFAQTLGSSLLIVCIPYMLRCCASMHICFHRGFDVQHILLIRG